MSAICEIDGCTKPTDARGLCSTHWSRWRRHGDPLAGARVERESTCTVEGCFKPHTALGLCKMHRQRLRRHGSVGGAAPLGADGYVTRSGYRRIHRPGHPQARTQGQAYEHRVVLYDAIGPGTHACHWCATPVRWGYGIRDGALIVDHLDDDRLNNDRANLVPSCNDCNTRRHPAIAA